MEQDRYYMQAALDEAKKAYALGEIPVGAVMVYRNAVIAQGYNLKETQGDPTAHAEITVIRQAAQALGSWRLTDATLYVTLEPCAMCAGAIVQARITRLVYGIADPKAGAVCSLMDLVRFPAFNHQVAVTGGVLADECRKILRQFFQKLRQKSAK